MFPFDRISLHVFGRASARLTSLGHPGLFLFDEDEDDEDDENREEDEDREDGEDEDDEDSA